MGREKENQKELLRKVTGKFILWPCNNDTVYKIFQKTLHMWLQSYSSKNTHSQLLSKKQKNEEEKEPQGSAHLSQSYI